MNSDEEPALPVPATGELAAPSGEEDPREERLQERRDKLRGQRDFVARYRTFAWCIAVVLILIAPLFLWASPNEQSTRIAVLGTAAYGLVALAGAIFLGQRLKSINEEIVDVNNELDLLELVNDDRERRATKLLHVNQLDLKRYYDQALRQGNQIFYVGLICILAGFAVIGLAFWLIASHPSRPLSDKIVVAALGAVGGVLSNFIAIIYLRMFSKTTEAVGHFHYRLVGRDRVNFGNLLAAKIPDDSLREATLSEMALVLITPTKADEAHPVPDAPVS